MGNMTRRQFFEAIGTGAMIGAGATVAGYQFGIFNWAIRLFSGKVESAKNLDIMNSNYYARNLPDKTYKDAEVFIHALLQGKGGQKVNPNVAIGKMHAHFAAVKDERNEKNSVDWGVFETREAYLRQSGRSNLQYFEDSYNFFTYVSSRIQTLTFTAERFPPLDGSNGATPATKYALKSAAGKFEISQGSFDKLLEMRKACQLLAERADLTIKNMQKNESLHAKIMAEKN